MVGNHPSVKGGITSVIGQLLNYDWSTEDIEIKFIPTYIDSNNLKKITYFASAYIKIRKQLQMAWPNVVHIHMSYKGSFRRKYMIHKLCKKYGISDVVHLHGSEFKKWYDESDDRTQEKIRKLLRECTAFIVLGEKWDTVVKTIEPTTNTLVISNAVHIPQEKVQWNEDRFQVLFLGVMIQRKGVVDILKAVNILKNSNKMQNLHFVIAGSGEEEDQLKRQAERLGLTNEIEFVGWITGEKKKRLLRESQVLILPSYYEGLPVAVLEAISYGMPVVATDVGDISSAVHDGVNGYLIQPGDAESLADRIEKIHADKKKYILMSEMSRRIATNNFSDEQFFAQIKKSYQC